MNLKQTNFSTLWLFLACASALGGCFTLEENKQLTSINKDWNRMIRASHIQPIYPLTQDIFPGDVFLVSHDIEDTRAWKQPGYLPLDHLVARLCPDGYKAFYTNSWAGYTNPLPHEFLKDNSWSNAPVAGFPSYSFTVKHGGGASVALPIQGIPVGLSLMGAKQASGYVTLADAHTYGVDELSLRKQVWEYIKANQGPISFLLTTGRTNFLTVVTRVYTVGRVTISMLNDSSKGGSLWGGSPKEVTIPDLKTNDSIGNFTNMLAAVNASIPAVTEAAQVIPGGSLKFNFVSSRSISMSESFPKAIVVGYGGFSFAIAKRNVTTNEVGIIKSEILLGESIISNDKLIEIENGEGKPYTPSMFSIVASRLSDLLDKVDDLDELKAIQLAKNPPVRDTMLDQELSYARQKLQNGDTARNILKTRLIRSKKRSNKDLSDWEEALKTSIKNRK